MSASQAREKMHIDVIAINVCVSQGSMLACGVRETPSSCAPGSGKDGHFQRVLELELICIFDARLKQLYTWVQFSV